MSEMFRKIRRADFVRSYLALHDTVFVTDPVSQFPFVNKRWKLMPLPHRGGAELKFEEVDFLALMQEALAVGDHEFVVTDFETIPPHQESVIAKWIPSVLDQVVCSTALGILDTHLFGISGKWGIVSYWDHYFVMGGESIFMDGFVKRAGGMTSLKERFLEYAHSLQLHLTNHEEKQKFPRYDILKAVGWEVDLQKKQ